MKLHLQILMTNLIEIHKNRDLLDKNNKGQNNSITEHEWFLTRNHYSVSDILDLLVIVWNCICQSVKFNAKLLRLKPIYRQHEI